jgi:isopentenyldiphosphate isomerase
MPDLDMVLDRVDDHNRVSGTVVRRKVFTTHANFRVVHLLLFNSSGQLLLQHIASGLRHSGQWGSSAAGYIARGEGSLMAIRRKAREELGLVNFSPTEHGETSMRDNGCKKFISVFTATYDGPVSINQTDASDFEFLSLGDIRFMRTSGIRKFTKTFLHILDFYQSGASP